MKKKLSTPFNHCTKGGRVYMVLCLFCLATSLQLHAQKRDVVNQSIQWASINTNIKLHKSFGLALDGQFRFAEFGQMQDQLRAGLEFYISKRISFIPVHYSYLWNTPYGKQPASYSNNEHRIGQQLTYKHGYTRVGFSHRLRFEERFVQVHSKDGNDHIVDEGYTNRQFRIRYRALVNIPINKPKMDAKTFYFCVSEEIFISRGKSITYHKPDQNRVFAGPGYQFNKDLTLQGGFIYQTIIKSGGTKQENNMGVLLQIHYNFDTTKKETK